MVYFVLDEAFPNQTFHLQATPHKPELPEDKTYGLERPRPKQNKQFGKNLCEACHSTDDKIIEALDFAGNSMAVAVVTERSQHLKGSRWTDRQSDPALNPYLGPYRNNKTLREPATRFIYSPNHSPLTKIEETSECSEPVISGLNHKAMTQSAIFMAEKTIEGTADLFDIDAGYDID
ncbi:hypothetical protein J6590_102624 [Homalodisca vitripennis]|nr:hypothetical protein J6590_102624 [Homalodisca vitripennis]